MAYRKPQGPRESSSGDIIIIIVVLSQYVTTLAPKLPATIAVPKAKSMTMHVPAIAERHTALTRHGQPHQSESTAE